MIRNRLLNMKRAALLICGREKESPAPERNPDSNNGLPGLYPLCFLSIDNFI